MLFCYYCITSSHRKFILELMYTAYFLYQIGFLFSVTMIFFALFSLFELFSLCDAPCDVFRFYACSFKVVFLRLHRRLTRHVLLVPFVKYVTKTNLMTKVVEMSLKILPQRTAEKDVRVSDNHNENFTELTIGRNI